MKTASCIRESKDQLKIDNYGNLLNEFSGEFKNLSKIVGLIGNEIRLQLLWLINEDRFCVCDLADILHMSVPAISQHLRKLKDADIIESSREKQTIYYDITEENRAIVNHILVLVSDKVTF